MNRIASLIVLALLVAVAVAPLAVRARPARSDDTPAATYDRRTPVVRAIEKAGPAVVNIYTRRVDVAVDPFFSDLPDVFRRELPKEFFQRKRVSRSLGSGVLVHEAGYIVTNAHVVEQGSQIRVVLADGRELDADLVTADVDNDLAIIKVNSDKPLPAAQLGTSSDLMIGETVIAIGNPFGYANTVSSGIVSALDRRLDFGRGVAYDGLIQTDAAINPGNSGGALVNINGEVIGINSAIRAGAEGMGFAIPVDRAREILVRMLNFRNLKRLWLGAQLSEKRQKTPAGTWQSTLRVGKVEADSPAAKAELNADDEITGVDGHPVRSVIDFETALLDHEVGDTVTLNVVHAGMLRKVSVTLGQAPIPDGKKLALGRLGLHVDKLTPDLAKRFRTATDSGVLVLGVEADSPAAKVGFEAGDVIVQADAHRLTGPDDLGLVLAPLDEGANVRMRVIRGRFAVRVPVPVRGKPDLRH